MMQAVLGNVAGIDVHKKLLVITALVESESGAIEKHQFECTTMTEDLRRCARKLKQWNVHHAAMESTGIYWKPVHRILEQEQLKVTLGNAQHIKNVPGRKTDASDSEWLAWLHKNGLIHPSYVPEEEFQELRILTRHRTYLVSDLTRVKNRVQKVLEDANVKLSSVISNVFGVAGYAVLKAMAEGITNAAALAKLVDTHVKCSQQQLLQALDNCLGKAHCLEIKEYLFRYEAMNESLKRLQEDIDGRMQKYADIISRLDEIPGIDKLTAQVIIAEATVHMENFREDKRFAAWAGCAPGNYQSAGKKKRVRVRHGNPYLKRVLVPAARTASQKKGSYYQAKHRRLVMQTGSRLKASVAIANRICRAIYHIIKNPQAKYKDLGWVRVDDAERAIKRKIGQLKAMGLNVVYDGGNTVSIAQ
jgi:transposase